MKKGWVFILLLSLAGSIFTCAKTPSTTRWHPGGVDVKPICSECHSDEKAVLDHRADFNTRHKFYAARQEQTCASCHKASFCSDCHVNKQDLKPSDMYKDSPDRSLPHRGDYINQHRIDGKTNPFVCFKCHGRQNNQRCKDCHR